MPRPLPVTTATLPSSLTREPYTRGDAPRVPPSPLRSPCEPDVGVLLDCCVADLAVDGVGDRVGGLRVEHAAADLRQTQGGSADLRHEPARVAAQPLLRRRVHA